MRNPKPEGRGDMALDTGYTSPAPMEEVVESDPGDVLRSLPVRSCMIAPKEDGSRKEDGVSGALLVLAGDRSRLESELTMLGHKDRSLGKEDPAVRMMAASMTATC